MMRFRQAPTWRIAVLSFPVLCLASAAHAQSFSCPMGGEPACLGYGDRVVDRSAACFDAYQCDYEGFTCKSHLTDCASDYDGLQAEYNALVAKHNGLIKDFNALRDASLTVDQTLRDMQNCITWAESVEDARACTD